MTILTYWMENVPDEIEATAASLGIGPIAYVPPKFYTIRTGDVRTFNVERAERKFHEIADICDDATWIITDIEKQHKDAIRRPFNYPDTQVNQAIEQYIACWDWFRSHWPKAKLFAWNLVNARGPDYYTMGEKLILENLDGFAVSVFYRHKANWRQMREQIVAHAKSLVVGTDKIVIAGIHEKYKDHHLDGTTTSIPIPRGIAGPMVDVALQADVVMLWNNTYAKAVTDLFSLVNARVIEMLVKMRLQVEEQTA